MSDTPREPGAASGEEPEYRDPTAPTWDDGDRTGQAGPTPSGSEGAWSMGESTGGSSGEQTEAVPTEAVPTEAVPTESTQQLPPPMASQPPNPYGQAPNPYGQAQNPYAAGAPGGYPASRPGRPPAPGAPGTAGAGFPPGPPPAYGQAGYGEPAGAQPGYGQPSGGQPYGQVAPYGGQPGYAPSPYAQPRTTNTSAIALLVVSGISTLVGCFFAIPALVLGIMAVAKQNQSPQESAKFTRWGWIAYAIAVAFVVIGGIIAIALFASTSNTTGY